MHMLGVLFGWLNFLVSVYYGNLRFIWFCCVRITLKQENNVFTELFSGDNCCTVACLRNCYTTYNNFVRFEVLRAVIMECTIFWDIVPCCPLKVNQRFRETSPQFTGSKNKPNRNPVWLLTAFMLVSCSLILRPRRWRQYAALKLDWRSTDYLA